ncbi:MAG: hypothetical protein V7638_4783 [Acidobacteriota bacterium]|jgi:hypothetical protein
MAGESIELGAQAPGSRSIKSIGAREAPTAHSIDALSPVSRARTLMQPDPGLAPQALCCRPLRGLASVSGVL